MDIACCMKNSNDVELEENTFKQYYFPLTDDEDTTLPLPTYSVKRSSEDSIEEFFEEPKKKRTKRSSTVGKSNRDSTSTAYISTNVDDEKNASHLIKIEVYDMKKLAKINKNEHWKHADVRVKYFTKDINDALHRKARGLIFEITKEVSNSPECKKYSFKNSS